MFEPETLLDVIPEVSITLAGLTGVVSVLGNRQSNAWTPEERMQLRTLVETSLTVFFVSFLPGVLIIASVAESTAWRFSNLALGITHLLFISAFLIRAKNAQSTLGQRILLLTGFTLIGAHFLVFLNVLPWAALIFMVGLLQQLFVASFNFVLMLFPTHGE